MTQSRSWPGQEKGVLRESTGKILEEKKKKKTLWNKVAASLVAVMSNEVEGRQHQTPWGGHSGLLGLPSSGQWI